MPRIQVTVRLDQRQLERARKALGTRTTTETLQRALDLVTERAAHDEVIRKYSGVQRAGAFQEE